MAEENAKLTQFILQHTHVRGVLISAQPFEPIMSSVHGLSEAPALLMGQSLIGSLMLESTSKGGVRNVLQLDGENGPVKRILAEAKGHHVRGYMHWHTSPGTAVDNANLEWLGSKILLSSVRDLGFGDPYVSTIEIHSAHLADALISYLQQSVQIRADIMIIGYNGLMLEAMPGCTDEHWEQTIRAIAKIPDTDLRQTPRKALDHFVEEGIKILNEKNVAYACDCKPERMEGFLNNMDTQQRKELADEQGRITLSCEYCAKKYVLDA